MRILIMRHGETDANKNMIIQGRTDNPLNETGVNQAICKKDYFKNFNPSVVYVTSLIRTRQTFDSLNTIYNWNSKIEINDNFIERDFGDLDKKSVDQFYKTTSFDEITGYETDDKIKKRVLEGLNNLKTLNEDEVLIISHSHVLKTILILLNVTDDYKIKLENCQILELNVEDNDINYVGLY